MELGPIVEIIQVDRIARSLGVVRQVRRSQYRAPRLIIVVVARDGLVEFIDRSFIQRSSGLLTDPLFKLRIDVGRFSEIKETTASRFRLRPLMTI